MDEITALAQAQLDRIKALCGQGGLKYAELPEVPFGAGIAVGFSQVDFVILSILGGGSENKLMITSGILRDIKRDRLAALDAANTFTRENTLFPVYLHDAENGWSLLMQVTCTIDLLLDNPEYFDVIVRSTPQQADMHRIEAVEKHDLGGQPWQWIPDVLRELLIKSLA